MTIDHCNCLGVGFELVKDGGITLALFLEPASDGARTTSSRENGPNRGLSVKTVVLVTKLSQGVDLLFALLQVGNLRICLYNSLKTCRQRDS